MWHSVLLTTKPGLQEAPSSLAHALHFTVANDILHKIIIFVMLHLHLKINKICTYLYVSDLRTFYSDFAFPNCLKAVM